MNFLAAAIDKPFVPGWTDPGVGLRPFAPELWLIGAIVAVLLVPFFTRRSNIACGATALIGLIVALLATLIVGTSEGVVGLHFRGLLVVDPVAVFFKGLLFLFVIGIILMWLCTTASTMHEGDGPEFFTLLLGATLGMSLMASTSNLLMLFMSVELASLPSYVLAGFRKTNRIGAEASLKYVLFGAVTSSVMAYGLSLLYGLYGTLQVEELAHQMTTSSVGSTALLTVAIFGILIGVGFKISAVPFHFWCPDVFEGASIDVSAFLSVASKGAGLILLMRVLMILASTAGWKDVPGISLSSIAIVVGIIGSITATVGNTAAYVQTNIKRLLAYSSIAHAGYMMCALSMLLVGRGAEANFEDPASAAAQAILLYLAVYLFMNLGAFMTAGLIYRQTGSEDIRDYAGLGRRSPLLALCMFCCLISLIGLPPFAGFVAKLNLLWVLFRSGGWWIALIVVIGVNTILSAFYYFRVIRAMYLESSDKPAFFPNPLGLAISGLCSIVLVLLFIGWGPLGRATDYFSHFYLGHSLTAQHVSDPGSNPGNPPSMSTVSAQR
jgi:NADH-quinone oxidoreductase subunit N